jgi:hypothetical protein
MCISLRPSRVAARANRARRLQVSELSERFCARGRRAQAATLQIGNPHLDVKANLIIHVRANLCAAPAYVPPRPAPPIDRHIKPAAAL